MGLVGCSSQHAGLGAARLGHGGRRQFACRTGALGQVNYRQGGRSGQLPREDAREPWWRHPRVGTAVGPTDSDITSRGRMAAETSKKGRATSLQALRERRARRQKEARGLGAWLKFWVKLTSASGAGPSRCMGLARRQALSPRAEVIADGDRLSCWLDSQSSGLEDTRRGSRPRQRSGPRPSGSESEAAEPAMGGPRVAVKIREWPSMGARPFSPCAREIHEPLRLAIAGASSRRLSQW